MPRENFTLSDFDYSLPKQLIAQYPCERRTNSRLLVIERQNKTISRHHFPEIINYLSGGDCLVLNNTKVIWARLIGSREKRSDGLGGGKQEIFLMQNLSANTWSVLAKPAKKLTAGSKILFDHGQCRAQVISDRGMNKVVKFSGQGRLSQIWQKYGQVPLPPYIKRAPQQLDKQRYQTVYARCPGATAAPTAGLHFNAALLKAIRKKGVKVLDLTLHVNYGTFAPVKCQNLTEHKMHKEYFVLPSATAKAINATRAQGKKIFAVGTTAVRVLESCIARTTEAAVVANRGWTNLFIHPPYQFKAVDGLLTNFHFPKSTLLMLVSAFCGKELLFRAYQEAIKHKYRFFSYGDAMLIV